MSRRKDETSEESYRRRLKERGGGREMGSEAMHGVPAPLVILYDIYLTGAANAICGSPREPSTLFLTIAPRLMMTRQQSLSSTALDHGAERPVSHALGRVSSSVRVTKRCNHVAAFSGPDRG